MSEGERQRRERGTGREWEAWGVCGNVGEIQATGTQAGRVP